MFFQSISNRTRAELPILNGGHQHLWFRKMEVLSSRGFLGELVCSPSFSNVILVYHVFQ